MDNSRYVSRCSIKKEFLRVNVHEMMSDAKEWCIEQKIAIQSGMFEIEDNDYVCKTKKDSSWNNTFADCEWEAVFEAVELILKEKE